MPPSPLRNVSLGNPCCAFRQLSAMLHNQRCGGLAVAQDVNLFAGRTASLRLLLQRKRENAKVIK